jgi:hypothetical protein
LIHKYAPDFQIVDTAQNQLGRGKAFEDWAEKVNICVAGPDALDGNTKRMQQLYVSQKNRELWFYTCWMPQGSYANRFIEQKLLATRLLHWMNFHYKATGYLHWGYNMWNTTDPFKFVIHPKGEHPKVAGDAWIVYPGKNGPLDSIRHEAMRDGIADHELLSMLQERSPEAAEHLARIMVQSFTQYNTDVKVFRDTRRELLKQLSGKDR